MMDQNAGSKRKLSSDGKRAAHVKFDGRTIALGTFPDEEAEIICQRAKLLTKTWRDMYPKPSVEWVKRSLERSGIRMVNDRPGRQPANAAQKQKKYNANTATTWLPEAVTNNFEGEGDGISVMRQIQANSLLNSFSTSSKSTENTKISHHKDSATDTFEGGKVTIKREVGPSQIYPSDSLLLRKTSDQECNIQGIKGILKKPESNLQDLKEENYDHCTGKDNANDLLEKINYRYKKPDNDLKDLNLKESSLEKKEEISLVHLEDLDIEGTYTMLERHHANLINEIEETSILIDAYREERDRRRKAKKELQK